MICLRCTNCYILFSDWRTANKLVSINRNGPRKQKFPKGVKKGAVNGGFKDGEVTQNGGGVFTPLQAMLQ